MTARPSLGALPLAELARIALTMTGAAAGPAPPRSRVTAIVAAAVAIPAGFAGLACLFVALWIWVRPLTGPVGAPLVVAGALALLTIAAVAVLRRAMKPCPRAAAPTTAPSVPLDELGRLVVAHKGPVLLAALLAGMIAGGTST